MTSEHDLREWLRRYHRTPRFAGHLISYWLRRLLGLHCLVLIEEGEDEGVTRMRCQKCGRGAWFAVQGREMTAGVEVGCPMTDRLAHHSAAWMDEADSGGQTPP